VKRTPAPKDAEWRCLSCGETFTDEHAANDPGEGLAPPECPFCGEEARLDRVEPPQVIDLMAALKASLAKKGRQ
jgi:NAD-dependent SIR2 family protein deacetylase